MSRKLTFGGDERRWLTGWPLPWASPSPWSAGETQCHKDSAADGGVYGNLQTAKNRLASAFPISLYVPNIWQGLIGSYWKWYGLRIYPCLMVSSVFLDAAVGSFRNSPTALFALSSMVFDDACLACCSRSQAFVCSGVHPPAGSRPQATFPFRIRLHHRHRSSRLMPSRSSSATFLSVGAPSSTHLACVALTYAPGPDLGPVGASVAVSSVVRPSSGRTALLGRPPYPVFSPWPSFHSTAR
jgi:hypothetical protein